MTLHAADARLRAAEFGVRVVPVSRRGWKPYLWCSHYGSADEFDADKPCDLPIRFIRYPEEEYWFTEDGLLCRECYLRLAEHEGARV